MKNVFYPVLWLMAYMPGRGYCDTAMFRARMSHQRCAIASLC